MPVYVFGKVPISRSIVVGFWPVGQRLPNYCAFNFPSSTGEWRIGSGEQGLMVAFIRYAPFAIRCFATASPIKTNAEVTSGPPTRIRVGVFILFHS